MRLKTRVVVILLVCCLLMASIVFYFILFCHDLQTKQTVVLNNRLIIIPFSEVTNATKESVMARIAALIRARVVTTRVVDTDSGLKAKAQTLVSALKSDLSVTDSGQQSVWAVATAWVTARHVLPERAPLLGAVLKAMETKPIVSSDVSKRGTQLKLTLELEGGQRVLFKPMRYSREAVMDGMYSGADRHNGEIIAFHLSRLLDIRSAPIVSSRLLHVARDVRPVASAALAATFVNRTSDCFYGECYYCGPFDAVCPDEASGLLEGAVVLLLPQKYQLQKERHPWQRTYKKDVSALWETDMDYCDNVVAKRVPLRPRLLDLMDVVIFDFLLANADRHHLEVFKDVPNSALLLIDNGKSFGNPSEDELSVLLPLFQCCVVRNSTFQRLTLMSAFGLSAAVEHLLREDVLWPLLTRAHMDAMDRRLATVLALIAVCADKKGAKEVFVDK